VAAGRRGAFGLVDRRREGAALQHPRRVLGAPTILNLAHLGSLVVQREEDAVRAGVMATGGEHR